MLTEGASFFSPFSSPKASFISLDELARILRFADRYELQGWLITLPNELAFRIEGDYVILPREWQTDTVEAEAAITRLLESFKAFEESGKGKA